VMEWKCKMMITRDRTCENMNKVMKEWKRMEGEREREKEIESLKMRV